MTAPADDFWQAHLAPGERLLWQGRPRASARLEWTGPLDGVLSVLLFLILLIVTARFAVAGGYWWLLPGALLVYATWRLLGVHYWRSFERACTRYALTTDRALIARRLFGRERFDAYPITPEMPLDLVEAHDTQDLHFAERIVYHDPDKQTWTRRAIGFEQITGGRKLRDRMRQVQAEKQAGARA